MNSKKQEWEAEHSITPERARALIQEQFPNLSIVELELLAEGWDTRAFLVNREFVFRFPRRQPGAECLEAENRVLPGLAPLLSTPVPVPVYIGQASRDFPWSFSGYRFIPGTPAARAGLSREHRVKLAEPLALFLKELHEILPEKAAALGAGPDTLGRLDIKTRLPKALSYLEEVVKSGLITDPIPVSKAIRRSAALPGKQSSVLVHGDLDSRHILTKAGGDIAGIIDWGDVHLGNPAVDLSIVHGFLPAEGRPIFREAYGEIMENIWRLARFRALHNILILLKYGNAVGDSVLAQEAKMALEFILEE